MALQRVLRRLTVFQPALGCTEYIFVYVTDADAVSALRHRQRLLYLYAMGLSPHIQENHHQ